MNDPSVELLTKKLQALLQEADATAELLNSKISARDSNKGPRARGDSKVPVDRNGVEITIGAKAKLLTEGGFTCRSGTVKRLGKHRVTVELNDKQVTTRSFKNVRIQE